MFNALLCTAYPHGKLIYRHGKLIMFTNNKMPPKSSSSGKSEVLTPSATTSHSKLDRILFELKKSILLDLSNFRDVCFQLGRICVHQHKTTYSREEIHCESHLGTNFDTCLQ